MQQQKKPMNMMIFVILLVGVFAAYIFSTMFLRGCQASKPTLPEISSEELEPYQQYLTQNSKTPQEYILDLFQEHDIVFLGNMVFLEVLQAKQQVDLLIELVPQLYQQGITNVAILNVLAEDQEQIDTLLTAAEFDEQAVRQLLFNRLVVGGYEEYVEIFRTAWSVNSKRPSGAEPLRIVALSPKINYEYMKEAVDMDEPEDPELYTKVFGSRVIDDIMLEIIEREIVSGNEKAVIFAPQENCVIHFLNEAVVERFDKLGMQYTGSAAYRLHQRIGDRCFSVFLHTPWWLYRDNSLFPDYPAGGIPDLLLAKVTQEYKHRGFSLNSGPFAEIAIDKPYWFSDKYTLGNQKGILLKDLCDGYVILGSLSLYQSITLIPDFINESNFEQAKNRVPWPHSQTTEEGEELTLEKFKQILKMYTELFTGIIRFFGE
ncbi:MAG: hypothetical protein JW822_00355 [Spirochaetales bacterium]|nr:hypothetical protein [Spirochaetales bacterium]